MFSADIWSAMCVAVEMVTENLPWPRVTNYQTAIYKVIIGRYSNFGMMFYLSRLAFMKMTRSPS